MNQTRTTGSLNLSRQSPCKWSWYLFSFTVSPCRLWELTFANSQSHLREGKASCNGIPSLMKMMIIGRASLLLFTLLLFFAVPNESLCNLSLHVILCKLTMKQGGYFSQINQILYLFETIM